MAKKTYDVLKANEYEANGGEIKTKFITVGAGWEIESGGMSLVIEDGVSVTGKLVILPRKERTE